VEAATCHQVPPEQGNRQLQILWWIRRYVVGEAAVSRTVLFLLFVVQNGLVQLLHSQHGSFVSSVLSTVASTKSRTGTGMYSSPTRKARAATGSCWALAPMTGIGSLASTLAGASVSLIVSGFGLFAGYDSRGGGSSLGVLVALGGVGLYAYGIADENGFGPARHVCSASPMHSSGKIMKSDACTTKAAGDDDINDSSSTDTPPTDDETDEESDGEDGSANTGSNHIWKVVTTRDRRNGLHRPSHSPSLLRQSHDLFRRRPILAWLCAEVLAYQCQATVLGFLWTHQIRSALVQDHIRAQYTANVRNGTRLTPSLSFVSEPRTPHLASFSFALRSDRCFYALADICLDQSY